MNRRITRLLPLLMVSSCIEPGTPEEAPGTGGNSAGVGGAEFLTPGGGGKPSTPATGGATTKGGTGAMAPNGGIGGMAPNGGSQGEGGWGGDEGILFETGAQIGIFRPVAGFGHWILDLNNDRRLDGRDRDEAYGDGNDQPFVRSCVGSNNATIGTARDPDWWYWSYDNLVWNLDDVPDTRQFTVGDGTTVGRALLHKNKATSFINGVFYHDFNGNGSWEAALDAKWNFDDASGQPVSGFFGRKNGEGDYVEDLALFHDGRWRVDLDGNKKWSPVSSGGGDVEWQFGTEGDLPVVADFWGDARSELGVFRDGLWIIDANTDRQLGSGDVSWEYGQALDTPLVAPHGWYEVCD